MVHPDLPQKQQQQQQQQQQERDKEALAIPERLSAEHIMKKVIIFPVKTVGDSAVKTLESRDLVKSLLHLLLQPR